MITGKALLVIEALDCEYVPFQVYPYLQSCNGGEEYSDVALENFQLLDTATLSLPDAAYKMSVGEVIRVSVVYEFTFSCDYYGEYDVDLLYNKQRVLRKQKAKPRYISKNKRNL